MAKNPPPKSLQNNPRSRGATQEASGEVPPVFPPDLPPSPSFDAAMRGLIDRPFLGTVKYQAQEWRADWTGAHPDLVEFHKAFQARLRKLGIPMFAAEVVRAGDRQDELHAAGLSKTRDSAHEHGCSMDFCHSVRGWNLTDKEWALIGHLGKEVAQQRGLKITWGGDWSFYDPAHWEITFWKTVKEDYPWAK